LFLKNVIDIEDGNESVVAESEIAAGAYEARKLYRRQSRNLRVHVGVRLPELRALISTLVGRGRQQVEPGESAF